MPADMATSIPKLRESCTSTTSLVGVAQPSISARRPVRRAVVHVHHLHAPGHLAEGVVQAPVELRQPVLLVQHRNDDRQERPVGSSAGRSTRADSISGGRRSPPASAPVDGGAAEAHAADPPRSAIACEMSGWPRQSEYTKRAPGALHQPRGAALVELPGEQPVRGDPALLEVGRPRHRPQPGGAPRVGRHGLAAEHRGEHAARAPGPAPGSAARRARRARGRTAGGRRSPRRAGDPPGRRGRAHQHQHDGRRPAAAAAAGRPAGPRSQSAASTASGIVRPWTACAGKVPAGW